MSEKVRIKIELDAAAAKAKLDKFEKDSKRAAERADKTVSKTVKKRTTAPRGIGRAAAGVGGVLVVLATIVALVRESLTLIQGIAQSLENVTGVIGGVAKTIGGVANKIENLGVDFAAGIQSVTGTIGAMRAFARTGAQVDKTALARTLFENTRRAIRLENRQSQSQIKDMVSAVSQTLGFK